MCTTLLPATARRRPLASGLESARWAGPGKARLGECGPETENVDRGILAPRLARELRVLRALHPNLSDWRKLEPSEIAARFTETVEPDSRSLLGTAIFVGTAQATLRGRYWAPSHGCPGAEEVDCQHLARPISCLYPADRMPAGQALQARGSGGLTFMCMPHWSVFDACARLTNSSSSRQVAVLRFTGLRDARNESIRYGHPHEDQIFLRTTYFKAFEMMEQDINAKIGESIDMGGLIYTSGVGVLRGCLDEGALWFREPPKIDVAWIGLPARPQLEEQEQYALEKDRQMVRRQLGRAFAWAAAHGVDAMVLPAVGCGTHGCQHPSLDMADLIHQTAAQYARYIPEVCIVSDHAAHFTGTWWEDFSDAVKNGRPHPEAKMKVPPIAIPPYLMMKKDPKALLEKTRKMSARARSTNGERMIRNTFL